MFQGTTIVALLNAPSVFKLKKQVHSREWGPWVQVASFLRISRLVVGNGTQCVKNTLVTLR